MAALPVTLLVLLSCQRWASLSSQSRTAVHFASPLLSPPVHQVELDPYEIRLDCVNLVSTVRAQVDLAKSCLRHIFREDDRRGGREPMARRAWDDEDTTDEVDEFAVAEQLPFFAEVQQLLNESSPGPFAISSLYTELLLSPEPSPPIIDVNQPDRPHHASRLAFPRHLLHPSLQKDLAPYWEKGISLASLGGAMNRLYNSINDYEHGRVVPVAIVDGYAVYHDRAMAQTAKASRLQKQLESVLAVLRHANRTVPNVLFLQVLDSIPPAPFFAPPMVYRHVPPELRARGDIAPLVPVLAIAASRSGQTPSAIRVPNMYFGDMPTVQAKVQRTVESCSTRPFHQRIPQALWRGDSFAGHSTRFHHARNQALILQAEASHENLTNIRLVQRPSECLSARLTIRRWQAHGLLPNEVADRMVATDCGDDQFVGHEDFCEYRYLLNLPGSAAGSYSRNLQSLFATGSTVLHWDNDAVEWYYERLEHNVNYLVVDRDTLLPTIRKLNRNPGWAHSIASAGLDVLHRELAPGALVDFHEQLFHALAALQRFDVDETTIVDNACACHGVKVGQPLHGRVSRCKKSC